MQHSSDNYKDGFIIKIIKKLLNTIWIDRRGEGGGFYIYIFIIIFYNNGI